LKHLGPLTMNANAGSGGDCGHLPMCDTGPQ
jgi:hypothetical protein